MKKILLIIGLSIIISCSKDSDETPIVPPVTITNDSAIAYFKGSLNGQQFDYVMANLTAPTHIYQGYIGYTSTNVQFEKSYSYGCNMFPYPQGATTPKVTLYFNNMHKGGDSSETIAFPSMFASTPTNFLTSEQENSKDKGVEFTYKSSSDVLYSTLFGSQSGSAITYSSVVLGSELNLKTQTIIGTLNCKLYSELNPTDVITVTNGKFKFIYNEFN